MPHLWSTHTGETAWPHVEKENAVIFLYFHHIKVHSTSVFCAAITCWPLCTRAKESFDWLCNTKRRLIQYIRARCAFKMPEYSVCWCYVHATLTERPPCSHTWRLARTTTARGKAPSTWRASLSRLWSSRKPSTTSTATHLVPAFLLQRSVHFCRYAFKHMRAFLVVYLTCVWSPVSHTEPSHNPSAAQPDVWNHSHPPQVSKATSQDIVDNDFLTFNCTRYAFSF